MSNFVITKKMIEDYCKKGFTVQKMALAISNEAGTKCSPGRVVLAAKHFSIDLKTKKRPSPFEFEDVPTASKENTNTATSEEHRTLSL